LPQIEFGGVEEEFMWIKVNYAVYFHSISTVFIDRIDFIKYG
jgi:hypothetical protein